MIFISFGTSKNPLRGLGTEHGINARLHSVQCDRHGAGSVASGRQLAYLPWHAIARMHQRSEALTSSQVDSALIAVAALGLIIGCNDKHAGGAMSLDLGDLLLTGAVRMSVQGCSDGSKTGCCFLDVRTALPIDDATDTAMRKQGLAAREAAIAWLGDRTSDGEVYAGRIPYIAGRDDDYTARNAERITPRSFCTGR